MTWCPLTYELLPAGQTHSASGLRRLDPRLTHLRPLPFDTASLRAQARALADKLSIQGVQPKLSAKLDIRAQTFVITERGGTYILKPPGDDYPELPALLDLVGAAFNAASNIAEEAHKRSWTALPADVTVGELALPAAPVTLDVDFMGPGEQILEHAEFQAAPEAGKTLFLSYRALR